VLKKLGPIVVPSIIAARKVARSTSIPVGKTQVKSGASTLSMQRASCAAQQMGKRILRGAHFRFLRVSSPNPGNKTRTKCEDHYYASIGWHIEPIIVGHSFHRTNDSVGRRRFTGAPR